MPPESFSNVEDTTVAPEEKSEKESETSAELKSQTQEELAPEEREKKADEFDAELKETIKARVDAGILTPEEAETISREAEQLKSEDKAQLAGELPNIESAPANEKGSETTKEFNERVTGYEKAVDNLVERAKAFGVEVSSEGLKGYLEKLKGAELGEEGKEEQEEWNKSFAMHLRSLEAQVKQMERMKELGMLSSEKGKEAQKEFTMSFDQLVEQAVKFAVKFAVAVFKGLYKGIMGALKGRK